MPHTPGPWELSGRDEIPEVRTAETYLEMIADGSRPKKNAQPQHWTICFVHPFGILGPHDWSGIDPERRASARLIAAAPELLTALKTIVSASDDGWTDWLEPLLPAARAAIAKAEGRQPSPSAGTPSP